MPTAVSLNSSAPMVATLSRPVASEPTSIGTSGSDSVSAMPLRTTVVTPRRVNEGITIITPRMRENAKLAASRY